MEPSPSDATVTYTPSNELVRLLIALGAVFVLPQIHTYARKYFGGYSIVVFYLCTLYFRYKQHAPHGRSVYHDPDVTIVCRLLNKGRYV